MHDFKKIFDPFLVEFLSSKKCKVIHLKHVSKLLLSGGKRIRPYISYLAFISFSKKSPTSALRSTVLKALVGIELFHLFALMHDDIIDQGKARHGVQTFHIKYGSSQAILMGDLIMNWSFEALLAYLPAVSKHEVMNIFNVMVEQVIIGQMLDVSLVGRTNTSLKEIMKKTELKTAHYTFVNPMKIGMALAEVFSKDASQICESIGVPLGVAFQLQDDLLDIVGNSKETGKGVLLDLEEGQPTYFTHYINKRGTPAERKKLVEWSGRKLSKKDKVEARRMFEESHALKAGRMQIRMCLTVVKRRIEKFATSESYKKEWRSLVALIEERSY